MIFAQRCLNLTLTLLVVGKTLKYDGGSCAIKLTSYIDVVTGTIFLHHLLGCAARPLHCVSNADAQQLGLPLGRSLTEPPEEILPAESLFLQRDL